MTHTPHQSGRLYKHHIICGAETDTDIRRHCGKEETKLTREPEDMAFNSGYATAAYFLCIFQFSFLKKKVIYQMFPKLSSHRHF